MFIHHIYEKLCEVQEEACQLGLISLLLEIFYIKMQMQSITVLRNMLVRCNGTYNLLHDHLDRPMPMIMS